jgi:DNA-binding HxlR family transcriptional regulator
MSGLGSYGQFCPVAMAAEIVCTRWTILILREMMVGSTRFNELRKGVPRMSPALLSKRLRELEEAGVIEHGPAANGGGSEYRLTASGRDLWPVVESMGVWGQRWIESEVSLKKLDPELLMWDMRRNLDPTPMPERRVVIQFVFSDLPERRGTFWLVVAPDRPVELCASDPGFDVDLVAETDLRTMTMIWMGLTSVHAAIEAGTLDLFGETALAASMQAWLGLSPFAKEKKLAA